MKAVNVSFYADEKFADDKWNKGVEFKTTVFVSNANLAQDKAANKLFHNMIVADGEDKGKPIKYRDIEIYSLEVVAEE